MKHLTTLVLLFTVVVFSHTQAPLTDAAYTVEAAEPGKHLICDLAPGAYLVTRDAAPVSGAPFQTDAWSTISFQSQSGGAFVVTPAACQRPARPVWAEGETP